MKKKRRKEEEKKKKRRSEENKREEPSLVDWAHFVETLGTWFSVQHHGQKEGEAGN